MSTPLNPPRHAHGVGLTRREMLQVGYSGLLGLSLSSVFSQAARAGTSSKTRRARSVILVFLTGAPSHHDTFDMKPDAPVEIRGQFKPIVTRVPGLHVCEHLPHLAARTDKLAIVRSMSHRNPAHLMATHHVLTGATVPGKPADAQIDKIATREDWPCYAAGLDFLRPRGDGIPNGVTLPTFLIEGPLTWPGQHAGFLGSRHDPWHITQDPSKPNFRVESLSIPSGISVERMQERRSLLDYVDGQRRQIAALAESRALTSQQDAAFAMLTSGKVAKAFQLEREPDSVRDRYGRHAYGQSLLLARRLVEAGVPIVQTNMGIVQTWDSHAQIFTRLKDKLLPPLDRGVSALLDDLEVRGLLDETLVIMLGEFGRTPQVNKDAGRDHWAPVFFAVFAGGGVRGGQVIGRSDKTGAFPATTPYSPADLGATVYDALGIDPAAEIRDRQDRPVRLNEGQAMRAIYSGV